MILILLILLQQPLPSNGTGYSIEGAQIHFIYPSTNPDLQVFVSGNFNNWSSNKDWEMKFVPGKGYVLTKPTDSVRTAGRTFYEFTFRVNGKLLDASSDAANVIHCAGYGYRYTLLFK